MEYFAKSVPNGGSKEEQVTLKQHLDDTVKCAQDFLKNSDIIYRKRKSNNNRSMQSA